GRIRASTLARDRDGDVARALDSPGVSSLRIDGDDFVAVHAPLSTDASAPQVVILRSRGESLRFLRTLRTALLLAAAAGVVVAVFLSYVVARSVTRPLAVITGSMREMARTGDLARRIDPPGADQDDDTRLLTGTFNTLIDSIARFQRE